MAKRKGIETEIPFNVSLTYNLKLLEDFVSPLLVLQKSVREQKTKRKRKEVYRRYLHGIETLISYLRWSKRYDVDFLNEKLEELEEITDTNNIKFNKKDFRKAKKILDSLAEEVREYSPLDRQPRTIPEEKLFTG